MEDGLNERLFYNNPKKYERSITGHEWKIGGYAWFAEVRNQY